MLIAGGTSVGNTAVASAELYDPVTNSWSSTSPMATARTGHTATHLGDFNGRVLVTGGQGTGSSYLTSVEIYDPSINTWSTVAPLGTSRAGHVAARIADGRVLVAGGRNGTYLTSAALYDPTLDSWTSVGSMATARYHATATWLTVGSGMVLVAGGFSDHTATVLSDGRVLIVGGRSTGAIPAPVATVTIFDPATNTWTPKASMSVARFEHAATRLGNGRVLVTGGRNIGGYLNSCEIYDPLTNIWASAAPMNNQRAQHTSTLLLNGKVLVAGGHNNGTYSTVPQVYDAGSDTWNNTPSITARADHVAIELTNGNVLIAGGFNGSLGSPTVLASALLYVPLSNVWSTAQSLSTARRTPLATELGDGRVLVAGGFGSGGSVLSSTEIYSP